jgi:hypothetical protein
MEGAWVFAKRLIGGGEGAVQTQKVLLCGGGCVVELGLQEGDLQADIGLGAGDSAVDGVGGLLLAGGAAGDERGEDLLGGCLA